MISPKETIGEMSVQLSTSEVMVSDRDLSNLVESISKDFVASAIIAIGLIILYLHRDKFGDEEIQRTDDNKNNSNV